MPTLTPKNTAEKMSHEKNSHLAPQEPTKKNPSQLPLAVIDFISRFGWLILGLLAVLLGAYLFLFFFSTRYESTDTLSYLEVENQYIQLKNSTTPESLQQAIASLKEGLNKHPSLRAKYDALIAQTLLEKENPELATEYADGALTFAKSETHASPYVDYAETTLLISAGKYAEANAKALKLKTSLQEQLFAEPAQKAFGPLLYANNLLRLAMLAPLAGTAEEEQAAWKELRGYIQGNANLSNLTELFDSGNVTLLNYIERTLR